MSHARFRETGRGKWWWRVSISGLSHEAVSSETMERTTADGRQRICTLKRGRDLFIDEIGNPIKVVPDESTVPIEFIDRRANEWTRIFAGRPTKRTWLTAEMPVGGTTLSVASEVGWSTADKAYLGLETMAITGTSTGAIGVTKAQWGSPDLAHYSEDSGDGHRLIEVTDRPVLHTGRRVQIYAYGEGDDPQGDGTLFWTGIVASEPECEGKVWRLNVANKRRLLNQVLGSGLGAPTTIRGIRYTGWWSLDVTIRRVNGTSWFGTSDGEAEVIAFTGDFENQDDFLFALALEIEAAMAAEGGFGGAIVRPVHQAGGTWGFQVTIDGTTPRYIQVDAHSAIDGRTNSGWVYNESGSKADSVSAGVTYDVQWLPDTVRGARTVPRGGIGPLDRPPSALVPAADPQNRKLLIAGDLDISDVSMVLIEWPSNATVAGRTMIAHTVESVDTAERSVTLRHTGDEESPVTFGAALTREAQPKIHLARVITAGGHLGDAVTQIVADSATEALRAGAPLLLDTDIDAASFVSVVEENAAGRAALLERTFWIGAEITLEEWLTHEGRLAGIWIVFDDQGRLKAVGHRVAVATDPTITEVIVARRPWPRLQQNKVGTLKGAIVKSGYIPFTDEWERGVPVIDRVAQSRNPLAPMMDVEPRSLWGEITGDRTTHRELEDVLASTIGVYGYPYDVITFETDLRYIDKLCGDLVRFTPRGEELPNPDGTRTPTERVGQIIRRSIDTARGRMGFVVKVAVEPYAGYAPGYFVAAETNTSGNTWDLTLQNNDPFGVVSFGTDDVGDHLEVGDKVEVYEWGKSVRSVVTGTVDAIAGAVATVTFDAPWTPGSDPWMLRFQGPSVATANMQRYCYHATDDLRIPFPVPVHARVFAP